MPYNFAEQMLQFFFPVSAPKGKDRRIAMMDNYEKGYPGENVYYFDVRGFEPPFPRHMVYFARIHVLENPDPDNLSALEDPAVLEEVWKFFGTTHAIDEKGFRKSGAIR